MRTEMSRTFRQPNGSLVTEISEAPINFQDSAGIWQPVDTDLRSVSGGSRLQNTAGDVSVGLPATLGSAPVRVQDGADAVSFSPTGVAAVRADVDGPTAAFSDVKPATDITYEALPKGIKETVVLQDASAAASMTYSVGLTAGLSAHLESDDGSISIVDATGHTQFSIPAPTVQEAGKEPTTEHVSYALDAAAGTLEVRVDPQWLAQASFPVAVDPSIDSGVGDVCMVTNPNTTRNACGVATVAVGTNVPANNTEYRTFAHPAIASAGIPQDAEVLNATFTMTYNRFSVGSSQYIASQALGEAYDSNATWTKRTATSNWTAAGGTPSDTPHTDLQQVNATSSQGPVVWNVSDTAQGWLDGSLPNNGLMFSRFGTGALVEFAGAGSNSPPKLTVQWVPRNGASPNAKFEDFALTDRSQAQVNVATGQLRVSSKDIDIPGTGLDLSLNRTFDGADADASGAVGYRDYFDLIDTRVYKLSNVNPNLTRVGWEGPGGHWYFFNRDSTAAAANGDTTYAQAVGLGAHLTGHSDGSWSLKFDADGTTYNYAAGGLPTSVVDHNNNTIRPYFDASAHVTKITDTRGRDLTFHYKAGAPVFFGLSSGVGIDQITDSSGRSISYTWDANWRMTGFRDGDGNLTQYGLDANGRMTSLQTPHGRTLVFAYDSRGRVTQVRRVVDGTLTARGTSDAVWAYDYSPTPNKCTDPKAVGKTASTDADGHQTYYCYDVLDQVRQTFDALNRRSDASYDAMSNVIDSTSLAGTANSALSTFKFNSDNRPTTAKAPTGEQTENKYANTASATKYLASERVDEQGKSQSLGYDSAGNLTDIGDQATGTAPSNTVHLEYDPAHGGQVKTSRVGDKGTTSYVYDAANQLKTVSQPVPLISQTFTYDGLSRLQSYTDGRGIKRTIGYDAEDRIKTLTLSNNGSGSFAFSYDEDGYLTQRTDSAGNATTYDTNTLGQRTGEHFPNSIDNAYAYDGVGNLLSLADANGSTTLYAYDQINRVKRITAPSRTTSGSGADTVTYRYDDPSGGTGGSPAKITSGIYTDSGDANIPAGQAQTYKTITSLDASGKTTSIVTRDKAGLQSSATGPILDLSYAYTGASGPQAKASSQTLNGARTDYTYASDGSGRLTKAAVAGSSQQWSYFYDKAGNRTFASHTDQNGSTTGTSAAYDDANETCWTSPTFTGPTCGTAPSGSADWDHDDNGNVTKIGPFTSTYDSFDRLTNNGLQYLSPNNGELVADGALNLQNSTLGLIRTSGSSSTAYTRGPDSTPIAQRSAGEKQYFVADRNGSTLALISDTGSVVRTLRYDPDGNETTNSGNGPDPRIKWDAGQATSSGYHFGARYYSPSTGRWSQMDPLSQIGDLTQANRYAYAGGDPINGTDPTGLSFFSVVDDVVEVAGKAAGTIGACAGAAASAAAEGPSIGASTPVTVAAGTACAAGGYETGKTFAKKVHG